MSLPIDITARIIWRSLFLQGCWNFKRMQNIGFVYSILPGLKNLLPDTYESTARKYLSFFNTHPYMAPPAMGVFLHLEEQGRTDTQEKLKQTMSSSLAAIGDSFFWATLKPIIALILLLTIMLDHLWPIAMVLVLIMYNIIHLWPMTWGFLNAYRKGPEGAIEIGRILSVDRSRRLSHAIPLLAGMLLMALSLRQSAELILPWSINPAAIIAVFLITYAAFRLKLGVFRIFYGVFTLILIWTTVQ
ncbi:hypothetical protein EG833_00215 [archaeon]|nr:hypothetical protein [archaeon]